MGQEEEETEEEEINEYNIFAPEVSDKAQVLSTIRNERNDCLEREEWNDAVIFQHGVMRILHAFGNSETSFLRGEARTLSAVGWWIAAIDSAPPRFQSKRFRVRSRSTNSMQANSERWPICQDDV